MRGAFDEQRVQVDVARRQQRILAAIARDTRGIVGTLRRKVVIGNQRIAIRAQLRDRLLAVACTRLQRNCRATLGEPFDILQFHAIPRWIADYGIESARAARASTWPYTRKREFPVQELFTLRKRATVVEQGVDARIDGRIVAMHAARAAQQFA